MFFNSFFKNVNFTLYVTNTPAMLYIAFLSFGRGRGGMGGIAYKYAYSHRPITLYKTGDGWIPRVLSSKTTAR